MFNVSIFLCPLTSDPFAQVSAANDTTRVFPDHCQRFQIEFLNAQCIHAGNPSDAYLEVLV
jgi:hypothetical protein